MDRKENWTQHIAQNGLPYYYCKINQKSVWEKPACFSQENEQIFDSCEWKEHKTDDNKVFYYNTKLQKSVWEMPEELKAFRAREMKANSATSDHKNEKSKISPTDADSENLSQEQQIDIFAQLLKDKNINTNTKFDECLKLIADDKRNNVIKQLSLKKKVFYDCVLELKRKERETLRNQAKQTHTNFTSMLEEKQINSNSKFHKVVNLFRSDPRYRAIDERDREYLFQDYLDDCLAKEKEEFQQKRRDGREQLKALLVQHNVGAIKWREFNEFFKAQSLSLKQNNSLIKQLKEYDRFCAFSEYVLDAEQAEKAEQRNHQRTLERHNREAFNSLLQRESDAGLLVYKTKWKTFLNMHKDDPLLLNLLGQPGSTAREIFEDHISLLLIEHKKIKEELKLLLKKMQYQFNPDSNFKEFSQQLKKVWQHGQGQGLDNKELDEATQHKYFDYSLEKYKAKQKEANKQISKATLKLQKFLRKQKIVDQDALYEQYRQFLEQNSAQKKFAILSDEMRREIFIQYITLQKAASQQNNNNFNNNINNNQEQQQQQHQGNIEVEEQIQFLNHNRSGHPCKDNFSEYYGQGPNKQIKLNNDNGIQSQQEINNQNAENQEMMNEKEEGEVEKEKDKGYRHRNRHSDTRHRHKK